MFKFRIGAARLSLLIMAAAVATATAVSKHLGDFSGWSVAALLSGLAARGRDPSGRVAIAAAVAALCGILVVVGAPRTACEAAILSAVSLAILGTLIVLTFPRSHRDADDRRT